MRSMRLSRATGQNSQQPSVNCVEEGSIPAMQAAEVVRYACYASRMRIFGQPRGGTAVTAVVQVGLMSKRT